MVLLNLLNLGSSIGTLVLTPPRENGSGGPLRKLYGREKTQDELVKALDEFVFVSVCGVPGVGKSVLVENVANIFRNRSYSVRIIDMLDSRLTNMSALITHLYTSSDQAEGAMNNGKSNGERVSKWWKSVASFEPVLLILDNLDGEWIIHHDTLHDLLIQPLLKSYIPSKSKVMAISHQCFEFKGLHHKILQLSGISDNSCADWISKDYAIISHSNSTQLCHILGGVPMAVKLVASFIADPLRSHEYTPDKVISKLNSSEFGDFFKYLVGRKIINEGSNLMDALFLVYDSLEVKYRRCIYFLVTTFTFNNISVSNRLSHEHIVSSLQSEGEIFANECIEKLLMLSLMEKVPHSNEYQFNKFVVEFILWLEEPKMDDTFKQMARRYWGNVIQKYVEERRIILNEERSIQLAIQIGSNQKLVNSLLPLLGKNFTLMPLFKHALNIIDEQFCYNNMTLWCEGLKPSDLIFAYSYLTKVVHCPEYHPTSLLLISDSQTAIAPPTNLCSDVCSKHLMKCGKKVEMFYKGIQGDIEVAEAFAHYSALLMLTSCSDTQWKPFLFDLAMIIVTANRQCELYCQRTRLCSCGLQSPIELGFLKFLTNERKLSRHSLEKFLKSHTNMEYHYCQVILKTLAIMTIHMINMQFIGRNAQVESVELLQRVDLNYSQLDPTCYLGVIEDVILPFLKEVHPEQDSIMTLAKNHQNIIVEQRLKNISQGNNEHPLSRYAIFFGLTALKTTQLQDELKWPEEVERIRPREAWVCSIIRDKTSKCQDSTKLPLLDQVKLKEAQLNDKILFSFKYIMDEEEFSKWDEIVQKKPWFYSFMLI